MGLSLVGFEHCLSWGHLGWHTYTFSGWDEQIEVDPQNVGIQMGVSKNRGKTPKMDGEHNGKPYEQMDDLGVKPTFLGNPQM